MSTYALRYIFVPPFLAMLVATSPSSPLPNPALKSRVQCVETGGCNGSGTLTSYSDGVRVVRMVYAERLSVRLIEQEFRFQDSRLVRVVERVTSPIWDDTKGELDFKHGSLSVRTYFIKSGNLLKMTGLADDPMVPASTSAHWVMLANRYKCIAHSGGW